MADIHKVTVIATYHDYDKLCSTAKCLVVK